MKVEEFLNKYGLLMPNKETLIEKGMTDQEVIEIQKLFQAPHKNLQILSTNELLNLTTNYDCSHLEITMVNFDNISQSLQETEKFYRVGHIGSDWLVIDRETEEIKVEKHDCEGHIICECAENAEKFLDALYEVARFVYSDGLQTDLSCRQSIICSELAGGGRYLSFYKMLLNCDN